MNEERKKGSSDLLNLRSWRKIKMVVSFRSVSLVNTKLRIAGANFWGEAVSEKLTRQQQTSQLPAGILISIKVLLRRDMIQGSKRPKRQQ